MSYKKINWTLKAKLRFFKKLGYTPHNGQFKIHAVDSRFKIVVAASRFGKTTLAAYEVCLRAMQPNQMIWCVAPTYDLADKVFRIVVEKLIYEHKLETLHIDLRNKWIQLANGTTIRAKSAHIKESLLGEGVDFMVVDEASRIPDRIWTSYLRPRLGDKIGDAFLISSPCGVSGWFTDMYQFGLDNDKYTQYRSWKCPIWDNNLFPVEEIEAMRLTQPPEVFRQECGAEFVPPGGRVYKAWDEDIHVSHDAEFVPGTPFELGWDFGGRNPTAVLFFQRVGPGMYNVFDEYFGKSSDMEVHAKNLQPKFEYYLRLSGHKQIRTYNDPSGLIESVFYKKWFPYLLPIKANNDQYDGINTVRAGLLEHPHHKRIRVLTHPRCVNHIREMNQYHYKESNPTEVPVPVNDHTCDARRYYLHTIDPFNLSKPDLSVLDNKYSTKLVTASEDFGFYGNETHDYEALQDSVVFEEFIY